MKKERNEINLTKGLRKITFNKCRARNDYQSKVRDRREREKKVIERSKNNKKNISIKESRVIIKRAK